MDEKARGTLLEKVMRPCRQAAECLHCESRGLQTLRRDRSPEQQLLSLAHPFVLPAQAFLRHKAYWVDARKGLSLVVNRAVMVSGEIGVEIVVLLRGLAKKVVKANLRSWMVMWEVSQL